MAPSAPAAWKGSDQFQQFDGKRIERQIPDLSTDCSTKARAGGKKGNRQKPAGQGHLWAADTEAIVSGIHLATSISELCVLRVATKTFKAATVRQCLRSGEVSVVKHWKVSQFQVFEQEKHEHFH